MAESQPSGTNSTDTPKDNGYIPGDDAWTICRNLWRGATGKMTPEGMEQFRVARDIRNEKEDCKRCEDQRDHLLQFSKGPFNLRSLPCIS